jgi:hypothetical protein
MVASSGLASITMPGPPPYGRSSTVRWRSLVKSRGFQIDRPQRPARARAGSHPTASMRQTFRETSSRRQIASGPRFVAGALIIQAPVQGNFLALQVDGLDELVHKRDQALGRFASGAASAGWTGVMRRIDCAPLCIMSSPCRALRPAGSRHPGRSGRSSNTHRPAVPGKSLRDTCTAAPLSASARRGRSDRPAVAVTSPPCTWRCAPGRDVASRLVEPPGFHVQQRIRIIENGVTGSAP